MIYVKMELNIGELCLSIHMHNSLRIQTLRSLDSPKVDLTYRKGFAS